MPFGQSTSECMAASAASTSRALNASYARVRSSRSASIVASSSLGAPGTFRAGARFDTPDHPARLFLEEEAALRLQEIRRVLAPPASRVRADLLERRDRGQHLDGIAPLSPVTAQEQPAESSQHAPRAGQHTGREGPDRLRLAQDDGKPQADPLLAHPEWGLARGGKDDLDRRLVSGHREPARGRDNDPRCRRTPQAPSPRSQESNAGRP